MIKIIVANYFKRRFNMRCAALRDAMRGEWQRVRRVTARLTFPRYTTYHAAQLIWKRRFNLDESIATTFNDKFWKSLESVASVLTDVNLQS